MKKFLCAILFLTMVISLSACGGKGVSTLVKHYGQEKVDAACGCISVPPDFPPLQTVRDSFPSHGFPSSTIFMTIYTSNRFAL